MLKIKQPDISLIKMGPVFRTSIVLLFSVTLAGFASAQDQNYSQFYAAPTLLNPALTGSYAGKYRVSALYRDQWRSSLEAPITSFITAVDLRFDLEGGFTDGDAFAIGLQFASDQAGPFDLSTNSISGSGAYHKALDRSASQIISAGFQFSAAQRNILYENLVFQDQFNGLDGFDGLTSEDLPENNFSFGDLAVGLNYFSSIDEDLAFYIGGAMHHILTPEISFYAKDSDKAQQEVSSSSLFRKYSLHGGATFKTLNNIGISPRAYAALQGSHFEFLVGNVFILEPNPDSFFKLHLGAWIRFERNFESAITPDVLGLQVGLNLEQLLVGFSYDINLNNLANYGGTQGVFEVSISYFGNYESEENLCPTF